MRARVAAAGWACVSLSVKVRVRARQLTPAARGSRSPRQEAGTTAAAGGQGRGRRAQRTRSLHMEDALLDE